MEKKTGVIGLGIAVIVIVVVCIILVATSDKKGPQITYDENNEIVYKQGDDDKVLLEDVVAIDKNDGNVSDSLIVVGKIINDDGTAKITYMAKDRSNNITQVSRVVKYIKIEEDDKEQSVSEESKEEDLNESEENETKDESNPTGEIDKKKADETGIPVIKIVQTELSISAGEKFSSMDALGYVKETYDNSGDVSRRIHITGVEDNYEPGDYNIVFTVSDTEGNISEPVTLILHVN